MIENNSYVLCITDDFFDWVKEWKETNEKCKKIQEIEFCRYYGQEINKEIKYD